MMAEYDVYILGYKGEKHFLFTLTQEEMDRLMCVTYWFKKFKKYKMTNTPPVKNPHVFKTPILLRQMEDGKAYSSKELCSLLGKWVHQHIPYARRQGYIKRISEGIHVITPLGIRYAQSGSLRYKQGKVKRDIINFIYENGAFVYPIDKDKIPCNTRSWIINCARELKEDIEKGVITNIICDEDWYGCRQRFSFKLVDFVEKDILEAVC